MVGAACVGEKWAKARLVRTRERLTWTLDKEGEILVNIELVSELGVPALRRSRQLTRLGDKAA
jgi:hypothetical protein